MHIRTGFALSLFCLGITACGHSDGGSSGTLPGGSGNPVFAVDHTLALSQPVTISAGAFYGFEFQLPSTADVSFSASETTTDTWNIAIFSPAEWVSYQSGSGHQAEGGVHNGVMQAADSVTLPAGDWYLGFRCTNTFEHCVLSFNADASLLDPDPEEILHRSGSCHLRHTVGCVRQEFSPPVPPTPFGQKFGCRLGCRLK